MEAPDNKYPNALIWIAGVAIILFCGTGIAAIMGWIPTSMSREDDDAALPAPAKSQTRTMPSGRAGMQMDTPLRPAPAKLSNEIPAHRRCAGCGVIMSVRVIESGGQGSGLGAVGGGLLGGVLGNQVGGGRGRDLATVAGAIGGVVAGNEIEKRIRTTQGYDVTIRLHDGSSRVIREVDPPQWRSGDHVKIVDGVIHSN